MSDWMTEQVRDHGRAAADLERQLDQVREVAIVIERAFAEGGKLWTFGNGGSAADAQHFTGELIGHYRHDRPPLPAVTLSTDPTAMTCIANDYSYADVFSRQVTALAQPGDVVAAFTTSGRSSNIVDGLAAAKAAGATTVLFGGGEGGPAKEFADFSLLSPSTVTPRIQELHTLMLHLISEHLDNVAAGVAA
ncbi:MAG: SIS domain-containing protein [Promicromonosporaceae bacterium]|nr:SIS domain-containing protein [Promicromonosporaceae bacterium]